MEDNKGVAVEFTDGHGKHRTFSIDPNQPVSIIRDDETVEASLAYNDGVLEQISVRPHNGNTIAAVKYANGCVRWAGALRFDKSLIASIRYRQGEFSKVLSNRKDNSIEASIEYEAGLLRWIKTFKADGTEVTSVEYNNGELQGVETINNSKYLTKKASD